MTQELPSRPSLAYLKKQAKQLLRRIRSGDQTALQEVASHFPRAENCTGLRDAQWVIARRYGFAGWQELCQAVEIGRLNALPLSALAEQFVDLACVLYDGGDSDLRYDRAARLLKHNPGLSEVNMQTAVISHNLTHTKRLLANQPALAVLPGGPRNWPPLMYLTYNRMAEPVGETNALKIARLLLEHGADPNSHVLLHDSYRFTVLTGALGEGEGGVKNQPPHPHADALATLLLDAGADPNDGQALYNTCFTHSGDHWLKRLVDYGLHKDCLLDWDDRHGTQTTFNYLLGVSTSRNFTDTVTYLLAQGADPNSRCFYTGRKVYSTALIKGHNQIAQSLLDAGAVPGQMSTTERFLLAIQQQDTRAIKDLTKQNPALLQDPDLLQDASVSVLRTLLDAGMNINRQNDKGKTVLHVAAANGMLESVKFLLAQGAREDLRDKHYQGTAVGWAHFNSQTQVRDYLLSRSDNTVELSACGKLRRLKQVLAQHPALAGKPSQTGNTPLHAVCNWLGSDADYALRASIMDVLLQFGADIHAVNGQGQTPLDLSREVNDDDNVTLLVERGAH